MTAPDKLDERALVALIADELYHLPAVTNDQARTCMDAADLLRHMVGITPPVMPSARVAAYLAALPAAPSPANGWRTLTKTENLIAFALHHLQADGSLDRSQLAEALQAAATDLAIRPSRLAALEAVAVAAKAAVKWSSGANMANLESALARLGPGEVMG